MHTNLQTMVFLLVLAYLCPISLAKLGLSLNRKYFYAGIASIDTSASYNNQSAAIWNPNSYNISLPFAFTDNPVAGVALAVTDISVNYVSSRTSFYGQVGSFSQSWLGLNVFSNFSFAIQILSFRYLVYTKKYADDYNWKCGNVIKSVQTDISMRNLMALNSPFNSTSYNYLIGYSGFDFKYINSQGDFKPVFSLSFQYINTNETRNISLKLDPSKTYIYTIHFTYILYNLNYYNNRAFALFQTTFISSYSNFTNAVDFFEPSIFLMAYYFEKPSNDNSFKFKININSTQGSISIPLQDTQNFHISANVLMLFTYYCNYNQPYYYKNSDQCHSTCPQGTINDIQSLNCNQSPNPNPIPKIVGITVGSVLFIAMIIIIACLLYKKRSKKQVQPNRVNQQLIESNLYHQSNGINSTSVIEPVPISQLGIQRDRPFEVIILKYECNICFSEQAYFRTQCNHFFHITCILEWAKRHDSCPNCRHGDLVAHSHLLFCSRCKLKQKWVKFSELAEKHEARTLQAEVVCPLCKLIPI